MLPSRTIQLNEQEIQDYYTQNPVARWLALTSICLANFINAIQNSSINIAIPKIVADLHADAILVSWIPTSFLLTSVVLLLPSGRLADIHGRKKIYLSGIVVLAVATTLAMTAQRIEWLLFTRMLQGIGAAMTFATGLALVMSLFTAENRGTALGLASGSVYIGLACGPLIGGWLTQRVHVSHPAAVYILCPGHLVYKGRVDERWTAESGLDRRPDLRRLGNGPVCRCIVPAGP